MLNELRIENLAVISRAELLFSPGLNVITGETGAGKTILAHAISLLLGARAGSGLIRPGSDEASIEAIFAAPPGLFADLSAEVDIPQSGEIIVRRRISRDGRSRAYLGGRACAVGVLEQVTGRLLAFSAQHEQRRLMMAARQLDILDAYGGSGLLALKDRFEELYDRRTALVDRLDEISQTHEARAREMELLKFQADEIEVAAPAAGEEDRLEAERRKLAKVEELREATAAVAALLGGGDIGESLLDAYAQILARLEAVAGVDAETDAIKERLQAAFFELEEVSRSARDYSESVERDPVRLAEIEERLDLLHGLKRKYGATLEEVIEYAHQARERLELFLDMSSEKPRLTEELQRLEEQLSGLALDLRSERQAAATGLAADAAAHLGDLAFGQCAFEVRLKTVEGEGEQLNAAVHLRRSGADIVEFEVSPNPGMPPRPIRETASGGELSRIMLAIKSSVSGGREAATLVFDEIDAGIGGETGLAVGAKLRGLAVSSQIICITHLPQIACYVDAHFSVVKESGGGGTDTRVFRLGEEDTVDELCRMMGSKPQDAKARAHAQSLLKKARAGKGTAKQDKLKSTKTVKAGSSK